MRRIILFLLLLPVLSFAKVELPAPNDDPRLSWSIDVDPSTGNPRMHTALTPTKSVCPSGYYDLDYFKSGCGNNYDFFAVTIEKTATMDCYAFSPKTSFVAITQAVCHRANCRYGKNPDGSCKDVPKCPVRNEDLTWTGFTYLTCQDGCEVDQIGDSACEGTGDSQVCTARFRFNGNECEPPPPECPDGYEMSNGTCYAVSSSSSSSSSSSDPECPVGQFYNGSFCQMNSSSSSSSSTSSDTTIPDDGGDGDGDGEGGGGGGGGGNGGGGDGGGGDGTGDGAGGAENPNSSSSSASSVPNCPAGYVWTGSYCTKPYSSSASSSASSTSGGNNSSTNSNSSTSSTNSSGGGGGDSGGGNDGGGNNGGGGGGGGGGEGNNSSGSSTGGGGGGGSNSSGGSSSSGGTGNASGGVGCDAEPVCTAAPDDPSGLILCEQLKQQWLQRCPKTNLSEFGDGKYNGHSDHSLDIFNRLQQAKDKYAESFNTMKGELESKMSISVGSPSGQLPCNTINILGVQIEAGICAREDFFSKLGNLIFAVASIIACFIVLRRGG